MTGEECWLTCAKASANMAASWCVSYDFRFPKHSQFACRGIRSTGAVRVSIRNKHAAPGICTLSGLSLFQLYRATGERKYLELFGEIIHSITQLVRLDEKTFRCIEAAQSMAFTTMRAVLAEETEIRLDSISGCPVRIALAPGEVKAIPITRA